MKITYKLSLAGVALLVAGAPTCVMASCYTDKYDACLESSRARYDACVASSRRATGPTPESCNQALDSAKYNCRAVAERACQQR